MVAPGTLGIIGFLNKGPSVCDVICETDIEVRRLPINDRRIYTLIVIPQACVIPMRMMDKMVENDETSPCILYRMWFWVAARIALNVLENQAKFEVSALDLVKGHSDVTTRK